ncbi:hypothetical protein LNP18_09975 [Leuconostoc citreum]|uniref:hypothetical protein n=1 Tax=Leuconostoc citreum TaxID=33964 RepID=UPI00200B0BE8|nr:hypothetical protein [Leuconostoc citreum]MCK8606427.1 hypothetical protein [Leuconostoc citreum]
MKTRQTKMSNSVLKGMNPRVQGNIPAKEQFSLNDNREKKVTPETQSPVRKTITKVKDTKSTKEKFVNQKSQIKISESIKTELDTLKAINKTKFDYEIIELLIDSYVQNSLTSTQKRKFKALTSDDF